MSPIKNRIHAISRMSQPFILACLVWQFNVKYWDWIKQWQQVKVEGEDKSNN